MIILEKVKNVLKKNKLLRKILGKNVCVIGNTCIDYSLVIKNSANFGCALNDILVANSKIWNAKHNLIGLGRLDKVLSNIYNKDINDKIITRENAITLLSEFFKSLHKDYYIKSASLPGDTGQVIILGGLEPNGKYFCNDLTYLILEVLMQLHLPEPKIVLRVSKDMPREIMVLAIKSIATGIGSPLLANDDVIIPALEQFGYDKVDSYNYVVSACWEPYVWGKSLDQNNISSINYTEPLIRVFSHQINEIKNYDSLVDLYLKELGVYIKKIITEVDKLRFKKAPILSSFNEDCLATNKDLSLGGAKYNNYGFTAVGLANVINSLLNVKKFVYDEEKYTLQELNALRTKNHPDQTVLQNLKANQFFGRPTPDVLDLINKITNVIENEIKDYRNYLGGKIKFGYSSPAYINAGKTAVATFDGRKNGEPLNVHISGYAGQPITELFNFAGKLDYSGAKINGNVVDFFVSPTQINDSFNKFVDLIFVAINQGFYEMQFNVVSSQQLIAAKNNPEKYKDLIVRVWGFSSYFNDIPKEYQDLLIKRALDNETAN